MSGGLIGVPSLRPGRRLRSTRSYSSHGYPGSIFSKEQYGRDWYRSRWGRELCTECIASSDSSQFSCAFTRSEEHTSELQSRGHLVCRLLLEKKKKNIK